LLRGSTYIPIKVVLTRYVCKVCGTDLEAYDMENGWWSARCQNEPGHAGPDLLKPAIERRLVFEGRQAWAEAERRREQAIEKAKENPKDPDEIHRNFMRDFYGEEE